jgi:hypothetical protein
MKKLILLIGASLAVLAGCASAGSGPDAGASIARSATQFEELGINPTRVEPWEDGSRTDGSPGTYEWWYFDFNLDDGSTLVIDFLDKNPTNAQTGIEPSVTFALDAPGRPSLSRIAVAKPAEYSSSKERCEVRIGACTVRGDLRDYTLHFEADDVRADITLHGTVPSWRPGTGVSMFGPNRYFAWLPSVPQGRVDGTIEVAGRSTRVTGVGYHDHNWGNAPLLDLVHHWYWGRAQIGPLLDLVHHWYWGRAQIGPYTAITSWITATPSYGSVELPVFMLARDGAIVAEDGSKVRFSAREVSTDPDTGKPVASVLTYDYEEGATRYRITFRRANDLVKARFVDLLPELQSFFARLAGFDGAYLRFGGTITLERWDNGELVETVSQSSGVWELMYFGHAPAR